MNYWVVGAMWGGQDDQSDVFIRRGYWVLGWDDDDHPEQTNRRDQIQKDDRIAIKRMRGQGSSDIEIRAAGIVTEIDRDDGRVYVDWVLRDMNRIVPSKGCYASIHGPFPPDDSWINQVFRI
ncbi:MAG: hypothetical protein EOM20_09205 [Spartobacteria bacterium]|nr:hypothetical protein [Spartobacteria bacterium]